MKANMADVNAAIGLAQIRQYEDLLKERKRVFEAYNNAFKDQSWSILPPCNDGTRETSYHVYALRIKDITEEQRDEIINEISKSEVAVNVHFIPLPMLTLFRNLGYRIDDYPQAFRNYSHEISLPCYPQLSDEQVQFVIKSVIEAYHKVIN
jgi:dTDP-4-amino-4,6-dideoxygalactose transaminase